MTQQTRRRRGQGMTEYIIIVGLIAIVLISVVNRFSDTLGGSFDAATDVMQNQVTARIQEAASEGQPGTAPQAPAAPNSSGG